jgi:hypothetical protein
MNTPDKKKRVRKPDKRKRVRTRKTSPLYYCWKAMRDRCSKETHRDYPRYGGRGITVDPSWVSSFQQFLADMGPKPTPQHSIDRINNDGNYEPSNCRWATPKEQSQNTCRTVNIEANGRVASISEWARILGKSPQTVRNWINKYGAKDAIERATAK